MTVCLRCGFDGMCACAAIRDGWEDSWVENRIGSSRRVRVHQTLKSYSYVGTAPRPGELLMGADRALSEANFNEFWVTHVWGGLEKT